jgi:hypothetical protein
MAYQTIPPSNSGGGGSAVGSCGAWAAAQYDFITALLPTLTGYQYIKPEQPMGTTLPSTNDGAAEGGGRTGTNNTITALTPSIFQTAKTGRCAYAARVKFLAAGAGQSNSFGIVNAAVTHNIDIGVFNSLGSGTNYYLFANGAVLTTDDTGVPNDLGFHTFVVTFDTTNIKVYIDGTLRVTRAITTNVVDEPMYMYYANTLSGETIYAEALYAYVAP